jgi:hypothetical protein
MQAPALPGEPDPARELARALAVLHAPGMTWALQFMLGRGGSGGDLDADVLAVLTAPAQAASAALVRTTTTRAGGSVISDAVLLPVLSVGDHSAGMLVLREAAQDGSGGRGAAGPESELEPVTPTTPASASASTTQGGGTPNATVSIARVCLNLKTGEALVIGSVLREDGVDSSVVRVVTVGSADGRRVDLTVERRALEADGGGTAVMFGSLASGVRRVACEPCAAERGRDPTSGVECGCGNAALVAPAGPLDFDTCRANVRAVGGVYVGAVDEIGGRKWEVVWRVESRADERLGRELVALALRRVGRGGAQTRAWGAQNSIAGRGGEDDAESGVDVSEGATKDARMERRRERNRLSAASANARRKIFVAELRRDLAAFQARQTDLRRRESVLRGENEVLRRRLEYRSMFRG